MFTQYTITYTWKWGEIDVLYLSILSQLVDNVVYVYIIAYCAHL